MYEDEYANVVDAQLHAAHEESRWDRGAMTSFPIMSETVIQTDDIYEELGSPCNSPITKSTENNNLEIPQQVPHQEEKSNESSFLKWMFCFQIKRLILIWTNYKL